MMNEISETDRIERDLANTRARMDHRLDELQDHLTPKQMLNDAFGYFSGSGGADFTKDLAARARANPLPVALVGIGVAWLMAANQGGITGSQTAVAPVPQDSLATKLRQAESNVTRADHDDDDSFASRLDDARGSVLGLARNASDTATSYAQRIKDAVADAAQGVRAKSNDLTAGAGDALSRLSDRAGEHAAAIQEGTQTMANSAQNAFSSLTDNPLALGGIAALIGILAGALVPTSHEEETALGAMATKLRMGGRDLAQDVVDRGGHIVADAMDAVKGSAEAHGLSTDKPVGELIADAKSGDLLGTVKQVAQDTLQDGKDSAQTHMGSAAGSDHR